jgi:hypothetical protein
MILLFVLAAIVIFYDTGCKLKNKHPEIQKTEWASEPHTSIVYIDGNDHFIKKINTDGSGITTLVPHKVASVSLSGQRTLFC